MDILSITLGNSRESPGIGKFDGSAEWDVRMQLADAHDIGAATVRRTFRLRTPAKFEQVQVTLITEPTISFHLTASYHSNYAPAQPFIIPHMSQVTCAVHLT